MITRYQWVTGPELVSRFERMEFHHGKGVIEPKGRQIRMFVGQIRDVELGHLLNWAIASPANPVNARIELREHAEQLARAADWSHRMKSGSASGFPKGWTLPEAGSSFERGIIL